MCGTQAQHGPVAGRLCFRDFCFNGPNISIASVSGGRCSRSRRRDVKQRRQSASGPPCLLQLPLKRHDGDAEHLRRQIEAAEERRGLGRC